MYDPLVLHSTLGVASSIWYMYVPRPFEARREGLRQKDLAIRGVQDRLAKYDTSDAVVGTVANLANMEACSSALHEVILHLHEYVGNRWELSGCPSPYQGGGGNSTGKGRLRHAEQQHSCC